MSRINPPYSTPCSRRCFLQSAVALGAAAPWAFSAVEGQGIRDAVAAPAPALPGPTARANARVSVVRCRAFGNEVHAAMRRAVDQLGGLGGLVRGKTVTVKLNLTGTSFEPVFGRPVGDSYMTHPDSALALASLLFEAGAVRVRFVESTNRIEVLGETVADAGWDVKQFDALGRVEWENTRNLGSAGRYATLKVPSGGRLFSSFEVNRAYADTDVLVSLCKLKNHLTCGVTLSMKNLFGMTPNDLYGGQAPNERGTDGRGPLHQRRAYRGNGDLPGEIRGAFPDHPMYRVPRIVADLNEARPADLAIIDGIVSMKGGEGPWAPEVGLISPGVLIVGRNPVSTDAVGTAVMGYADPRALKGTRPFSYCDNHIRLAEDAGVGVAALDQIEVAGERIADVVCAFG